MKKRKIVRLIFWSIIFVVVVIQFIPVDRSVPASDPNNDFLVAVETPASIKNLMTAACYDCHSYQTKYPWYAYIAPVSLWLQGHIDEGREHLNLSEWANYDAERRDHNLEEMVENVSKGLMPLNSYLKLHQEAHLTEDQRKELTDWFERIR